MCVGGPVLEECSLYSAIPLLPAAKQGPSFAHASVSLFSFLPSTDGVSTFLWLNL